MGRWVDFTALSNLPNGGNHIESIEGEEIAVVNIANHFYAFINECPHAYLPLIEDGEQAELDTEQTILTCPHHGAKFCLKTGDVKAPPAFDELTCYPTRVQDDIVQIELPD